MGGRSERCRRLVRHTLRRDIGYPEPYRARLTPRSPIRGALWRQDYLAKAIGAIDEFACRVRVSFSPRFRTIQDEPDISSVFPICTRVRLQEYVQRYTERFVTLSRGSSRRLAISMRG